MLPMHLGNIFVSGGERHPVLCSQRSRVRYESSCRITVDGYRYGYCYRGNNMCFCVFLLSSSGNDSGFS